MENTHVFQVWFGAAYQLVTINSYEFDHALLCVQTLYPTADLIIKD